MRSNNLRVVGRDETVARPLRRVRGRLVVLPWWALLFGGLGVVATIAVLVALFTPVGRWPPRFTAPELPAVDSEAFLQAVAAATATTVQAGGTAQLLNDGEAFYAAMLADIGAARRSVIAASENAPLAFAADTPLPIASVSRR